jgi:hypothetical protein
MRRGVVVLAIVTVALSAVVATSAAQASVSWPARCTTFKCVNAHLNVLNTRTKALTTRLHADERFYDTATICEGDALVNETQNEADNQTGITGEVGPIASALGVDCSTDFWPLFDPSLFGASAAKPRASMGGLDLFRARMLTHLG